MTKRQNPQSEHDLMDVRVAISTQEQEIVFRGFPVCFHNLPTCMKMRQYLHMQGAASCQTSAEPASRKEVGFYGPRPQ